jgi:hypothetical protein
MERVDAVLMGSGVIIGAFLQQVTQNFGEWLQQSFKCHGGHLAQVIFRN